MANGFSRQTDALQAWNNQHPYEPSNVQVPPWIGNLAQYRIPDYRVQPRPPLLQQVPRRTPPQATVQQQDPSFWNWIQAGAQAIADAPFSRAEAITPTSESRRQAQIQQRQSAPSIPPPLWSNVFPNQRQPYYPSPRGTRPSVPTQNINSDDAIYRTFENNLNPALFYDPKFSARQNHMWQLANYGSRQAREKYGIEIPAELIYRQWSAEAGDDFNSNPDLAAINNFGGLTQSTPNNYPQPPEAGNAYYREFTSPKNYTDIFLSDYIQYRPELHGVKTVDDYAQIMHDTGYHTTAPEEYAAAMNRRPGVPSVPYDTRLFKPFIFSPTDSPKIRAQKALFGERPFFYREGLK